MIRLPFFYEAIRGITSQTNCFSGMRRSTRLPEGIMSCKLTALIN